MGWITMTPQRWMVVGVICVGVIAHLSGAGSYLSFDSLKTHRLALIELVEKHSVLAPAIYMPLYSILVTFALPGATVMTLAAGVLFTQPFATIYAVIGAATGACCNYLLSSAAFNNTNNTTTDNINCSPNTAAREKKAKDSELLKRKYANGVGWTCFLNGLVSFDKIEKGIKHHEAIYMLLLRLVPIFPFWLVNIAPSIFGVKFRTFAWTTYIGIIPGSYLYTQCGHGLSVAMDNALLHNSGSSYQDAATGYNPNDTLATFLRKGLFNRDTLIGALILMAWLVFLLSVRWYQSKRYLAAKQQRRVARQQAKQQRKQEKVTLQQEKTHTKHATTTTTTPPINLDPTYPC